MATPSSRTTPAALCCFESSKPMRYSRPRREGAPALASCGRHERAVTSGPMDPTPAGLIMKKGVVIALLGILCVAPQAVSQQKTVTGKVTSEQGAPLSGVSVVIKGTTRSTGTNAAGNYTIAAEEARAGAP